MLGLLSGSLMLIIEAMNCERPRSAEVMATRKQIEVNLSCYYCIVCQNFTSLQKKIKVIRSKAF